MERKFGFRRGWKLDRWKESLVLEKDSKIT